MTDDKVPLTPSTLFNLQGRHALVTGAARGLGLAAAQGLAAHGATVWLGGRSTDALQTAVGKLREEGHQAFALPFDITDEADTQRALAHLAQSIPRLHILVNNAGVRDRRPLQDLTPDDLRRQLETHTVAPFRLARWAAKHMVDKANAKGSIDTGGRIINITSIAGPLARPGDVAYTTAKGALDAMTRALAAELGPQGIRVNAIAPGYFATPVNQSMADDPSTTQWLQARTSLGRWGQPPEIAGAVVLLASDAASYISGQTLAVDGGYLAHF